MKKETILNVIEEARNYDAADLQLFIAETGWQDWMNEFTEAAEDAEISEAEGKEIDMLLTECFNIAHAGSSDDVEKLIQAYASNRYAMIGYNKNGEPNEMFEEFPTLEEGKSRVDDERYYIERDGRSDSVALVRVSEWESGNYDHLY